MATRKAGTAAGNIRTAYTRTYPDTGQTIAHIEWGDGAWTSGDPNNEHMKSLLARAEREGVHVIRYGGLGGSKRNTPPRSKRSHSTVKTPTKDWLVTELIDRGPTAHYRYQVTGENLNHPPGHPDRRFSWSVPAPLSERYDLSRINKRKKKVR